MTMRTVPDAARPRPPQYYEPGAPVDLGGGAVALRSHRDIMAALAAERRGDLTASYLLLAEAAGIPAGDLPVLFQFPWSQPEPRHRELVALIAPALSARRVRRLAGGLGEHAAALAIAVLREHTGPAGGPAQVDVAAYARELATALVGQATGLSGSALAASFLLSYAEKFARRDPAHLLDPDPPQVAACLQELVGARRRDPGGELIDAVIAGFDGGLLTVRERDALIFGCVAAGRETTAAAVTAVFVTGWQHGLLGEAWRADPAWRAGFCCEVLRLSTPWPVTTLAAAAPARFGNVTVPAGGQVQLWWPAANLDPEQFPDPHRLDPARRGAAGHLAFGGAGVHACTGRHLALAAMDAAMGGLLPVLHSGARLSTAEMSSGLVDGWTRAVFTCDPALAAPFLKGHAVTAPR